MNPNSETIELRANKNLIKGSGQQQSKLYLIVNIGVDYELVEWDILSSYVLIKPNFCIPLPQARNTTVFIVFYFILYLFFFIFLFFILLTELIFHLL